jgi:uncharacterized protein YecE (DUF72 family)
MKAKLRKPGRAFIGTSGWNYRHWSEGVFYPRGLRQAEWLGFYAGVFDTVEVNNTFYHLPTPDVFRSWHDATPAGFTFAVKASRFITHMKKLAEPEQHVARFLTHAAELREKFGVVLFQLPPLWKFDPCRLGALLDYMAGQTIVPGIRVAVEVRHPSWLCESCYKILGHHHAALVFSGLAACPAEEPVTSDFIYIRRHGPGTPYAAGYPVRAIRSDAKRIQTWLADGRDTHLYFNNDAEGRAPRDARKLLKCL